MVVVFGRPGAGKTTISNIAYEKIQQDEKKSSQCILLDLDVCVPSWMKDNFAKGMYPTLEQRYEFATTACNYVDEEINEMRKKCDDDTEMLILVSFSFVNTDLRDHFRSRFPHSKWALVDVNDLIAQERIDSREGHFYKGDTSGKKKESKQDPLKTEGKGGTQNRDNSEWDFAPVNFEHTILNGLVSIEENSEEILKMLLNFTDG